MRKPLVLFSLFTFILLLTAGCAGVRQIPGWVEDPPGDTGEFLYFTAPGSGDSEAASRERAVKALITEITNRIGVKVQAETTVQAKSSLTEFQESLEETINLSSEAQIEALSIVESYTRRDEVGGYTVFLLGRYPRAAFQAEQNRLAALFAERQEEISGPEALGDGASENGAYYSAVKHYLQGAAAASESKVDNSEVKFRRLMRKASEALDQLLIKPVRNPGTGVIGTPFSSGFSAEFSYKNGTAPEMADFRISYPETSSAGRVVTRIVSVQSDASGMVRFVPPVPDYTGDQSITVELDLRAQLSSLDRVDKGLLPSVDSFRQGLNRLRVRFTFSVKAAGLDVATGIIILDTDRTGLATGENQTAGGILAELKSEGFNVQLTGDPRQIEGKQDDEVIPWFQQMFGDVVDRVLYGTAKISDFDDSDEALLVRVEGNLKLVDLNTGIILYAGVPAKSVRARSPSTATSLAFKELGRAFARDMMNQLR